MKLISLWEPWATLMAIGAKRIETRTWSTSYRGWLAIHASKGGLSKRDLFAICDKPEFRWALGWEHSLLPFEARIADFKFGHIVAVVNLVACLRSEWLVTSSPHLKLAWAGASNADVGIALALPWGSLLTEAEYKFGNFAEGRYGWVTEQSFRLPEPIPYKAHQGLCNLDYDTVVKLQEQWRKNQARLFL